MSFYIPSDIQEVADNLGSDAQAFRGKSILVTGALGFLGRYFLALFSFLNKNLLKDPCKLILIDNLITSGNGGNGFVNSLGFPFVEHNIIKPYETDSHIHYIIHLAGIASPFYYRKFPLDTLDVSVLGTRNMLELAKKNGTRMLYFSSSEIYGNPDPENIPTQESYCGNVSCLGPRACYDEGKRIGETLCRIYNNRFGTETLIVRPFNVYGPGMNENDYRVLPNFANRIKRGDPLLIYGSGNQTRTFTYITDALTGFILLLLRGVPGEPYNIGTSKPEISMRDLVNRIENILGRRLQINFIEYPDTYPSDEPRRRCPSIRKAKMHLKFTPQIDFDEGLKRFLNWAMENYVGEDI